jgi:ABC-type branched-subunit amino acid transport system substrate-binding protein
MSVLAGCSGPGTQATSPTPPAKDPAPGVTPTKLTIGATAPLTGPLATGTSEIVAATSAYFDYVNAKGGVLGRRIYFQVSDDMGDPARALELTKELVTRDRIFADVGPTGPDSLPGVAAVLNTARVPAVFMGSGCSCWNSPSLPQTFGWQPPSVDEGKILGQYVEQHDTGQPIGYISGADQPGRDGLRGLTGRVPATSVVVHGTTPNDQYASVPELTAAVRSLEAAGVRVVVLQTSPSATARLIAGSAALGYHPQWVLFSGAGDPALLRSLMPPDSAAPQVIDGVVAAGFLPPATDSSDAWVSAFRSILAGQDPGAAWDGASEYGMALAYTFVQVLQSAGRNLTRAGLVRAIEHQGSGLAGPGVVPLSYSATDHFGYQGAQVVEFTSGGTAATPVSAPMEITPSGSIAPVHATPTAPPAGLGR